MQKAVLQKYMAFMVPFLLMFGLAFFESALLFSFHKTYPLVSIVFSFVFYFRIFNPYKLNLILVFLLGVLVDFLMAYPLGFEAIAFLMGAFLVGLNRVTLAHLSFVKQWMAFGVILLCVLVISQMILGLFLACSVGFLPFVWDFLGLFLSYPFVAKGAAYINQKTGEF